MHEGMYQQKKPIPRPRAEQFDPLFARVHCENKNKQTRPNHDYDMKYLFFAQEC